MSRPGARSIFWYLMLVAACAVATTSCLIVARLLARRSVCLAKAADHARQEQLFQAEVIGCTFRAEVYENPSPANVARWIRAGYRFFPEIPTSEGQLHAAAVSREAARRAAPAAEHHARMARRFRDAASRPWRPIPPDEPGPRYEVESRKIIEVPAPWHSRPPWTTAPPAVPVDRRLEPGVTRGDRP